MNRLLNSIVVAALCASPVLAQKPPAPQPVPVREAQQEQDPSKREQKPTTLELGKTLPRPIGLPDIDGNIHRSQDLAGKLVVVNFWSITCPIMRGWESRLTAIHEDFAKQGVVFLMVNSNESNAEIGDKEPKVEGGKPYQKIRTYLAEHELPYTVLVDHGSELADLFQAKTTPDVFVFDAEGVLVYRGLIDDDPRGDKGEKATQYLKPVLEQLLAGEKIEPKATKPIGCGIKRPAKRRSNGDG